MSSREEFEKAYTDAFISEELKGLEWVIFAVNDSGEYLQDKVATAYEMWQARVPEGYVVVPKEPTSEIIVAIESKVEDQLKASAIEADPFRLDGETIYEAMIEAVEK